MSMIHGKYPFGTLDTAIGGWTADASTASGWNAIASGPGNDFTSAALPLDAANAKGPNLIVLANMESGDEETNPSSVIADGAGDLFGTTPIGGANGGTVFELAKTKSGYASAPTTLLEFGAFGGSKPGGSLIADAEGNLFATTTSGGFFNRGVVFELAKTNNGYAKTQTVLAVFTGSNGQYPIGNLITDAVGNLFGVTAYGGVNGYGTVFEIFKNGSGYDNASLTLASFTGADGATPYAGLTIDAAGDLFGTTGAGGADGDGTAFEIAKTKTGYAGAPATLVSFNGANGEFPAEAANLIIDTSGNLFGMTSDGGANGYGTVFEVAKTKGGYAKSPTILVSFNYQDGASPYGSLIIDGAGDLFGATQFGGANGEGEIFEIAKKSGGYARVPTTVINFNGTNGRAPVGSLIADSSGNLFGATYDGGAGGQGVVFEVTDSGFAPAVAPAATNENGVTKTIVHSAMPRLPSFVSTMAGFGASAASHIQIGEVWSPREPTLTSPRFASA